MNTAPAADARWLGQHLVSRDSATVPVLEVIGLATPVTTPLLSATLG